MVRNGRSKGKTKRYFLSSILLHRANRVINYHLLVIHSFLNNGQALNDKTFTRILKRINPNHSEVSKKTRANVHYIIWLL